MAPEIDQIKSAVYQYYGITNNQLMHTVRGISNEPRNVAIYLPRVLRRDGLLEISTAFGMQGYSSASSAVVRVKKNLPGDKLFQKRILAIENVIVKK